MNPFFSIIIPTYNAEKLLPAALQSILEQSFYDYEVIIMDGFSSDNTFELAHKYAEDHPQIKIFREKDAGIYDAMNKAIQISQGKFLFFLGSDDVFFSDSILSEVYKELHKKTVDVIYGDVFSDRFGGKYDGEFTAEKLYFKNICHQSLFINKSVFHKTGLFNLKYIAHADYDHNIKWFLNKAITKRYIHLIVAKYADGGFSSINGDPIFARDKEKLFFSDAFGKVSLSFYIKHCYPKLFKFISKIK